MDLFVQLVPKAETLVYHLLRNACLEIKQDIGHITEYKLVWVMTCENTFFQMVRRKRNQKSKIWNPVEQQQQQQQAHSTTANM